MAKSKDVTVKRKDLENYISGIGSYFSSMPFCFDEVVSEDCVEALAKLEEALES